MHKTNFQNDADENKDSYEEEDLVKDEKFKIKEEKIEILMEKPLQQSEAEKPKAPIEEQMGAMINCKDCSFSSENENISKLHFFLTIIPKQKSLKGFLPRWKI